jgi:hypothetical protein
VAAFTARLRHTVDLDTVRLDLLGVTEDAFAPAHVSGVACARADARGGERSSPDRIRTGVTALRGRRPRPLDDGAEQVDAGRASGVQTTASPPVRPTDG